jgi:glycosyltransferase involved in cell wall biosynthesis
VARSALAVLTERDLVINGHVDFSPIVALCSPPGLGPRVLTITHGVEVWDTLPFYKRLALKRSARIWSVSEYTRQRLISRQGVNRNRVDAIHTPIDPELLALADEWRRGDKRPIPSRLLAVTRMNRRDRDKGIDDVIRAMPAVLDAVPDATFTVVGDGDGRAELEGLASSLGLDEAVRFAGRVSESDLHAYLAGADVFVLPSRKEGFGLVFLEAMAHGKPVVAGAHGGAPEVVKDGQTGILVRHGDRTALVDALTRLLTDPALRRRMGEAGADLVRTRFAFEAFACTIAAELDRLLDLHGDDPMSPARGR